MVHNGALLLSLLLLFVGNATAETAAENNQRALDVAGTGQYKRALKLFEKAVEQEPTNPDYVANLGVTLWRLDRLEAAYGTFVDVVRDHPNFANGWRNYVELRSVLADRGLLPKGDKLMVAPEGVMDEDAPPKPAPAGIVRAKNGNGTLQHKVSPLPTLTYDEFLSERGAKYRAGRLPFKVTRLPDHPQWQGSTAFSDWSFEYFARKFPDRRADFYPHNMGVETVKPYITTLETGLAELMSPSGRYPSNPDNPGAYVQFNVMANDWREIMEELGDLPAFLVDMETWFEACLPTVELQDSFSLSTHWHMVLLGTEHAGMFNHWDIMGTASYQIQVRGEKQWHLCAPTFGHLMGGAGSINTFNPDYEEHAQFKAASCFLDTVKEGELVYYPANYWHQTVNLGAVNIAASGSVVDLSNYDDVRTQMQRDCGSPKPRFSFTKEVCATLDSVCYPWWQRAFEGAFATNEETVCRR